MCIRRSQLKMWCVCVCVCVCVCARARLGKPMQNKGTAGHLHTCCMYAPLTAGQMYDEALLAQNTVAEEDAELHEYWPADDET